MILKVIVALGLFTVAIVVPRRLLRDEKGQMELGVFGWLYTLAVAWALYLACFFTSPRLMIYNSTHLSTVVVEVGQHRISIPRGGFATVDLPDEILLGRADGKVVARAPNGEVLEEVILPRNRVGWIYDVLNCSSLIWVDYTPVYSGQVAWPGPPLGTVTELENSFNFSDAELPSNIETGKVRRAELIPAGESGQSVARERGRELMAGMRP